MSFQKHVFVALTSSLSLEPSSAPLHKRNTIWQAGASRWGDQSEDSTSPRLQIALCEIQASHSPPLRKCSELCWIICLMPFLHALLTSLRTWITMPEFLQERKNRLKTQNPNRSLSHYRSGKNKLKGGRREDIRIFVGYEPVLILP